MTTLRSESLANSIARIQRSASGATISGMTERLMIYGATGYTGKLVAAEAVRNGLDVVLAGRNTKKLKAVAERLGCPFQMIALEDANGLRAALNDVAAVLHIAGPFSQTAAPMVEACLATRTHYLDVTGEIDVFEAIARRGPEAEEAGVVLLPGVGFDVVPSDCVAAYTAARIEEPTVLRIAIAGADGGASRGTAKSAIEGLGDGLRVRESGIICQRPLGSLERHFDFGAGPARAFAVPWGDVATAFYSTHIPRIEVYFVLSGQAARLLKMGRFVAPFLRLPQVRGFLKGRVDRMPEGPSEKARNATRALLLAEVEGPGEQVARTLLETPSGYALTPIAAIESAVRVLAGVAAPGFHTPATAFGADFILDLADCRRTDLE
jgi:short subunit dehydrogenase-like uncharacterized protein